MMTSNGTTLIEATFILNGTPDAYKIEIEKSHNECMRQSIYTRPSTFAVLHVHPNSSGQYPSTPSNNYTGEGGGDTGMADRLHVDVYVIHRDGLSVYRWQTKETVLLRRGMSWTSPKGCQ